VKTLWRGSGQGYHTRHPASPRLHPELVYLLATTTRMVTTKSMKTKKLKFYLQVSVWVPSVSDSTLSRQVLPGRWVLSVSRRFNNKSEVETWLDTPMKDSRTGLTPRQLYHNHQDNLASDGHLKYKLEILRK
jgi:hypothetical protein